MQSHLAAGYVWWAQWLLVLAGGTGVIVLAAALAADRAAVAARWLRSAVWHRTIWQAATIAVLGLVAAESVGAGTALIGWLRSLWPPAIAAPSDIGVPAAAQSHAPMAVDPEARFALPPPPVQVIADTFLDPEPSPADEPVAWEQSDAAASVAASPVNPRAGQAPPLRGPVAWPAVVWAIGTLVVLARTAWPRLALLHLGGLRSAAARPEARSCADRIARRVGLRRRVRLVEQTGLSVPVAFGIWRPTIVLPAGFWDRFGREEQEAMLAHELAHLAARDPLWQLLAELACALEWWHPAVWWMRGRLRAASETAADEASLLVPGGPDALAGCLVALGRRLVCPRRLGWLSFQGNGFRSGLGRRVERLLSLKAGAAHVPARAGLKAARMVLPVVLVVVSVLSTAWARPQAFFSEGETTMSVWRSSWRHSLAAIVVTAFWGSASQAPAQEIPKPPEHKPAAVHKEGPEVRHEIRAEDIRVIEAKPSGQPHVIAVQATAQLDPRARELHQRRKELEERTRDLAARLRSLKPGQDREAQELKEKIEATRREIEEVTRQIERAEPGAIGPEVRDLLMKRAQLERKAWEIEAKARQRPDSPEARELREALEKTHREIAEITERLPPQMRGMKIALGEKGRVMAFGGAGGGGMAVGVGGPPPIPPEERERRMKHLKIAVENLHAAGLPDQAERLAREGEAILQGRPVPGMMPPGPPMGMPGAPGMPGMMPGGPVPPGAPGMGPPPPQPPGPPEAMLRELSEQIRALQRQIDELRQQVRPREEPRPRGEEPRLRDEARPRDQARPREERRPRDELPRPDQPKPREKDRPRE